MGRLLGAALGILVVSLAAAGLIHVAGPFWGLLIALALGYLGAEINLPTKTKPHFALFFKNRSVL